MRRSHWLAGGLAGLVLLALAFAMGGGVYRTVNAGGGRVYTVNRFTGSSRELGAPTRTSPGMTQKERVLKMLGDAQVRDTPFIGDTATKLFHDRYGGSISLILYDPAKDTSPGGNWFDIMCYSLRETRSPRYFDNAQEACTAGYWPCATCFKPERRYVVARRASVRDWPDDAAPVAFTVSRGETLYAFLPNGDWTGVQVQRVATGERSIAWVRSAQLYRGSGPSKPYVLRWARDAEEAQRLRQTGASLAQIAAQKGWHEGYVDGLLGADLRAESTP